MCPSRFFREKDAVVPIAVPGQGSPQRGVEAIESRGRSMRPEIGCSFWDWMNYCQADADKIHFTGRDQVSGGYFEAVLDLPSILLRSSVERFCALETSAGESLASMSLRLLAASGRVLDARLYHT